MEKKIIKFFFLKRHTQVKMLFNFFFYVVASLFREPHKFYN